MPESDTPLHPGPKPKKVSIVLPGKEYDRLWKLAEKNRRSLSAQAWVFIEDGLQRAGA